VFDKKSYYVKTDKGLWIRASYVEEEGVMRMEYQTRLAMNGRVASIINENGAEAAQIDLWGNSLPKEWEVCSEFSVDTSEFMDFVKFAIERGEDIENLYYCICKQSARLAALGWGEGIGEPLMWFQAPLDEPCVVQEEYKVEKDHGYFIGLEGMKFTPAFDDADWPSFSRTGVPCEFMYDGRIVEDSIPLTDLIIATKIDHLPLLT
jgi:hypothetical protein